MRRLAPQALSCMALLLSLSANCNAGGRDAHDVAADFEGTVGPGIIERLVRDTDLERAPLTISVGHQSTFFTAGDQPALEAFLQRAASDLAGDRIRVTQEVVDDTGPGTQRLTLTLAIEHDGQVRYVPVALDLVRDGRRILVTRARVMR